MREFISQFSEDLNLKLTGDSQEELDTTIVAILVQLKFGFVSFGLVEQIVDMFVRPDFELLARRNLFQPDYEKPFRLFIDDVTGDGSLSPFERDRR